MSNNKDNIETNLVCSFCNRLCKNLNSYRQHTMRCPKNPNRDEKFCTSYFKGHVGWNRGLTADTNESVRKGRDNLKLYYTTNPGTFKGLHHTELSKQKISISQTEADHSFQNRYSHGKKGYYDNILFMSTYELSYYIYMRDSGHDIRRCDERFVYYDDSNKKHYYNPDFIVDDYIVEIKGYERPVDCIKYKAVPNLKVLYFDQIKHCIDYVKEKYHVDDLSTLYTEV